MTSNTFSAQLSAGNQSSYLPGSWISSNLGTNYSLMMPLGGKTNLVHVVVFLHLCAEGLLWHCFLFPGQLEEVMVRFLILSWL